MDSTSTAQASSSPLGHLIQERQASLGINDADLAAQLGFKKAAVVEMIKSGRMCLPLVRVPPLAAALGLDRWEVMRLAAKRPTFDFLQSMLCDREDKFSANHSGSPSPSTHGL